MEPDPIVPDRIERTVLIAAPIERVWALVTRPEHLVRWFGDAGAEIDLRPGGELALRWAEHGTHLGVVEEVEPPTRFSFRWAGPDGGRPDTGNSTLVEFTLTPDGEGTRLEVVESGFRGLQVTVARQARHAQENTDGWRAELEELRRYAQLLRT